MVLKNVYNLFIIFLEEILDDFAFYHYITDANNFKEVMPLSYL